MDVDVPVRVGGELVKAPKVKRKDLPKYWDAGFVRGCIAGIDHGRDRMLCTFLWMTGCRVSEGLQLRRCDIDFEHGTLEIRWQKSRRWNTRRIPMHPHLAQMLRLFVAGMKLDERVFPITRQRVDQIFKKKFGGGSAHRMRHSFAVNWLRCGQELYTLKVMMGHSRIETTLVYTAIVPVDVARHLVEVQF